MAVKVWVVERQTSAAYEAASIAAATRQLGARPAVLHRYDAAANAPASAPFAVVEGGRVYRIAGAA